MMKKLMILMMIATLLAVSVISVASASGTSVMYVRTANGKPVNVRSAPSKDAPIIGSLKYGEHIVADWSYAGNDGWTRVIYGGTGMGSAYIMSRFLVDQDPGPAPTPSPADEEKEAEKKLEKELNSEQMIEEPFYIAARPARVSGWVNFRSGPSKITSRIASYTDGKELIAIGETTNWYKAKDPETGYVGYIFKQYTARLAKQYVTETETPDGVQNLGKLNVNGEFELTCKLPAGYSLQTVNMRGDKIIASVLSEDMTRPQMYLTIAYDETYANVRRMNDLSEEDLALLENSFREMNDVTIEYKETGFGTKLLVARETGADADFVDILTIYNGYFVEFNMSPNPKAADQTLSDEQVRMCIDFLTNVEFRPANAEG